MVFILFLDKKSSLKMIKFYHIFYVTESPIGALGAITSPAQVS